MARYDLCPPGIHTISRRYVQIEWQVTSLSYDDVADIVGWRYAPPYEMYSPSEAQRETFLDANCQYCAVRVSPGRLLGFACFGAEGRVHGGEYPEDEQRTLDVGVGLHPDHVGQGLGGRFVLAILKFGVVTYHPERFRATIAAFNQRSLKTFLHLGFRQVHQFTRESDGLPFVQIIAPAKSFDGSIYPGEQ